MRGLADYYQDRSIFRDALYGFIFGIIGAIALSAFVVIFFFVSTIASVTTTAMPPVNAPMVFSAVVVIVLALVIFFIFYLLEAVFYRRAFDALAAKSGEGMFRTAGLLLLIGAILTIVAVGFVLLFVAWILAAVGFFSIRAQPTPVATATAVATLPPGALSNERKYCPSCGSENNADAAFCVRCGRKL